MPSTHRLSFRAHHVRPIAERVKTDTVRPVGSVRAAAGDLITCHVNVGRPAFAVCRVKDVDHPTLAELQAEDAGHAAEVVATYGVRERYLRIRFDLVEFRLADLRAQNLKAVRGWLAEMGDAADLEEARERGTDVAADGVAAVHAANSIALVKGKVANCQSQLSSNVATVVRHGSQKNRSRFAPNTQLVHLRDRSASCSRRSCKRLVSINPNSLGGSDGRSRRSATTSTKAVLRTSTNSSKLCGGQAVRTHSAGLSLPGSMQAGQPP